MIDPMTSLAFSVYSGKGVHALLLGSGISRTSGIPTGWDIVKDLIRRIAAVEVKECGDDPEAWYLETYRKEPNYSELLELVAPSSTERMQLLKSYFEPTSEEEQDGKKVPTAAHNAIARLVADGYIRVIVTTNFDRLMERALEAAGVVPSVIASTDSVRGAAPLSQSRCTIIKVHGDYLDSRLKNTPEEVGKYDRATNRLLNQVLDEYGLIVCGWSADWDLALRAAIERCPNRRYTTYWSSFRGVSGAAQQLCAKRDARVIDKMGADEFFGKLVEKVEAMRDMDAPHPLSVGVAVATLKKYMAEDKDRIRLHDLMMGETEKVATAIFNDSGDWRPAPPLAHYESKLSILLPLVAAGGYWGKATQRRLWLRCFHRMVTPRSGRLFGYSLEMDYYPAFLLFHAFGIAALAGNRPGNLAYIMAKGRAKDVRGEDSPLLTRMVSTLRTHMLDNAVERADPIYQNSKLPTSRYLQKFLRDPLRDWISEDGRYEEFYHRFEYLMGLVLSDMFQKRTNGPFAALAGLYLSRRNLAENFRQEIDIYQDRWPFLRAGLFDGSLERLLKVKDGFDQDSAQQKSQLGL